MSTKQPDGGPAFPLATTSETTDFHGMTLRDWFAGQALLGVLDLCRNDTDVRGRAPASYFAKRAFEIADAMLEAREDRS